MEYHLWYYAVMLLVPCSIATYNFTLGYLRNLNPKLIPFYMSTISVALYGAISFIKDVKFTPEEEELETYGIHVFWLLALVANGACYLAAMQTKILGFRYDLVTRVAPVEYLETPYSLIVDAIVFNVSFSMMQLVGLGIVITMFIIIILTSLSTDSDATIDETKTKHKRVSSTDSAHSPWEK